MNGKVSLVLALIVAFAASAVVLNAYVPENGIISDEEAETLIAQHFILNAPTYAFDGIDGTLRVVETMSLESWPVQYIVVLSFESSHAGYGDRTGEVLAQVVTTHVATVKVVNGEVVQAIIDDIWNELDQRDHCFIDDGGLDTIISPETAVNKVVNFIARNHEGLDEVAVASSWSVEDLTPQGMVGSSTQRFTGVGWTITVSWSVVQFPVYNVEAEYDGSTAFQWEGTVDHRGNVDELRFELSR
jgi:ribosomal protein S12